MVYSVECLDHGLSSQQSQLEVHGRARREAARRRKSERKVNLDIRNSSRSNGSWRMTTYTVS